ncbi:hypothetical protein [Chryseobacterium sp.]|uniref:hypothetical protein n=1 Tax=Chryseobacterium sp. TaxID=1871047 RepID=UPI00289A7C56|nr:hypothetical protein [Chryseobacterium sp.]
MTKRKFILFSILKTFLFSVIISWIFFFLLIYVTRKPITEEYHPRCDMSGLAYGISLGIYIALSLSSFTALLSILKPFQDRLKSWLCWFLLPVLITLWSVFSMSDGKLDPEVSISFLIIYLPWFLFWGIYYYRYKNTKLLYLKNENTV